MLTEFCHDVIIAIHLMCVNRAKRRKENDMCKNLAEELMEKKIVTIMRGVTGEKALYAADAIAKGGLQFLEVTFDPSGRISQRETLETIAALSKEFGSILHIGAGTVLAVDQVEAAHEAGAGYIISPDTDEKIIHRTKECGMLSLPGALTPTEIKRAHGAGADFVKLFPVGNQEGIEQLLLKNSIKKDYGRVNLSLKVEEDIEEILGIYDLNIINKSASDYSIRLKNPDDGKKLINELVLKDMTVVKYELREPTLHEIFIEKVGHEHE